MGATAPFLSMALFGLQNLDTRITPYEIEKRVSQEELWTHYLGHCNIGKKIKIPWEEDNNPSASLFRASTSNDVLLQDHRNRQTINIYHFLIKIGKVESFRESVNLINEDFNLGLGKLHSSNNQFRKEQPMVEVSAPKVKFKKTIRIIKKKWSVEGYRYWQQFGIKPSTLQFFNVYEIAGYHIQYAPDEEYHTFTFPRSLVFAYEFYDADLYDKRGELQVVGYKILNTDKQGEGKWVSNIGFDVIQGHFQLKKYTEMFDVARLRDKTSRNYCIMDQMCKGNSMWEQIGLENSPVFRTCLITKSLKDIMVWYELGIVAIAPQNETPIFPSASLLYDLSMWFDNVIVNYDDDVTGRRNAIRLIGDNQNRLHGKLLLTTPSKDISDYVKEFNLHSASNKFKTYLQNLSAFEQKGII